MFCNKHKISDKYNNIFYLYITKYKNCCFKKKGWAFGRKSSPSFCQDTPDKESRCHWEVIMMVLTDGKDASIAYCLTTALYCPLPGQYLAIARHKTIRRERKSPLSFLLFTLHQIAWNPDKHWGSERWRVGSTLHHPSPTLHLDIFSSDYAELTEHSCSTDYARIPSGVCLPWGVPADLQSAVKKCSTYETGGFAIPPQYINS